MLVGGLAKTGTTGLLYLIANSLGRYPKILFEPKECPPSLETEVRDILAKVLIGPELKAASFSHFDRKVTLVRDPRDRIVSNMLYSQYHANYLWDDERVDRVRDVLERKEASPSRVSLREILEVMDSAAGHSRNALAINQGHTKRTLDWFSDYVAALPDAFFYKYEDFVAGNYGALEGHLGIALSGAAEVPKEVDRVVRTKASGGWRDWLTDEDVKAYRPLLVAWLEKYGYDAKDWVLNAEPSIAAAHCSGYFMRLMEEQRRRQKSGKAMLHRVEPRLVSGWGFGSDPRQPILVALLIDGKVIAQQIADHPRPGLKTRGIHPTGNCGFAFRFDPAKRLRVGAKVLIQPVDMDVTFDKVVSSVVAEPPES